mmetsp:Transcript_138902/g.241523  ORF Transcript_138902/g.241523 Transcript_138902/m.241523 type:complete len:202 (+) Transcript_138902:496-1101(+)
MVMFFNNAETGLLQGHNHCKCPLQLCYHQIVQVYSIIINVGYTIVGLFVVRSGILETWLLRNHQCLTRQRVHKLRQPCSSLIRAVSLGPPGPGTELARLDVLPKGRKLVLELLKRSERFAGVLIDEVPPTKDVLVDHDRDVRQERLSGHTGRRIVDVGQKDEPGRGHVLPELRPISHERSASDVRVDGGICIPLFPHETDL